MKSAYSHLIFWMVRTDMGMLSLSHGLKDMQA